MKILGVSRMIGNLLNVCVCQVDLCVNVVDLHIKKKHINY
jgi:hypothetical protein